MAGDGFDSQILYECWLYKLKGTKRKSLIIGSYPWRQKYFILRVVGETPQLEYYNKYPQLSNVKPKAKLQLWPAYKVEKISDTKNRPFVFEVTTTDRRLCLSGDDQQSMDHFVFMMQIQMRLIDEITDDYFVVKPDNSDACRRIHASGKLCILHVAPWGVTLALKECRAVLAQWPVKSIRSYESSGTGWFQVDVGRIAPLGDGQYVFNTQPTQDDLLYDLLDKYVTSATNESARSFSQKELFREYELESNRLRALTVVCVCTNERAFLSRLPSTKPPIPSVSNGGYNTSTGSSNQGYLHAVNSHLVIENPGFLVEASRDQPESVMLPAPSPPDIIKHTDRQSTVGYHDMNSPSSNHEFVQSDEVKAVSRELSNELDPLTRTASDGVFAETEDDDVDLDAVPKTAAELMFQNGLHSNDTTMSDQKFRDDYDLTSSRRDNDAPGAVSPSDISVKDDYTLMSSSKPDLFCGTDEPLFNKRPADDYDLSTPKRRPTPNEPSVMLRSQSVDDIEYTKMTTYENVTDHSPLDSENRDKNKASLPFDELQDYKMYVNDVTKGSSNIDHMIEPDYETVAFRGSALQKRGAQQKSTVRRSVSNPNFFNIDTKNLRGSSSVGHVTPINSHSNRHSRNKIPAFKRRLSKTSEISFDSRSSPRLVKLRPQANSWKSQPDLHDHRKSTESIKGIFTTAKTRSFVRKTPLVNKAPPDFTRSKSVDKLHSRRDSFESLSSVGSPNPNHGRRLPSLPIDPNSTPC